LSRVCQLQHEDYCLSHLSALCARHSKVLQQQKKYTLYQVTVIFLQVESRLSFFFPYISGEDRTSVRIGVASLLPFFLLSLSLIDPLVSDHFQFILPHHPHPLLHHTLSFSFTIFFFVPPFFLSKILKKIIKKE
jgi:hypothetical protein